MLNTSRDSQDSLIPSVKVGRPYPSSFVFHKRGHRAAIASAIVCIGYLAYSTYLVWSKHLTPACIQERSQHANAYNTEITYLLCMLGFGIMILIAAEMTYKTFLLMEELRHLDERYHGSVLEALQATFFTSMTLLPIIVFVVWLIILSILAGLGGKYRQIITLFWETNGSIVWTQFFLNSVGLFVLGLRGSTNVEVSRLSEKRNMNVAHGLAWSYYLGYLKLVLPGLDQRVRNWSKEQDQGQMKVSSKLYVLIPQSCQAHSAFTDIDSGITHAGFINFELNRAGNIRRSFRQTMYAIKGGSDEVRHCVMEYATPVMSLFEMSSATEAEFSAQDREIQVKLFFKTLNDILSKPIPGIENKVVLVPFQDRTKDGGWTSISNLMLPLLRTESQ